MLSREAGIFAYELRDDRLTGSAPLVLAVCIDGLQALRSEEASFLSEAERESLRQFPGEPRPLGFLRGRWAAKQALVRGFGGQHREWSIANGVFGQPVAQFDAGVKPPVAVSVSHSNVGALALAVPAACPAAIDCEVVSARNLDAIRSQMGEDELTAAARSGLPVIDALTMLWSLKESACKVLGAGLSADFQVLGMTQFAFSGDDQLRVRFRHFAHIQGHALRRGGQVASLVFAASSRIAGGGAPVLEQELALLCKPAGAKPGA
jgi:phosphopantetheinyl transferase